VFHGRCLYADERCRQEVPTATPLGPDGLVACHRVAEGKM
ncbi:MAG: ABC transporter ATP-binding protein, partial [Deltaproteobacteria bacterium]|nr:ABC transporter ATP-binding protein [Deltaproteobacteria bacterium]